ncbi:hypothetical protein OH460_08435 [Vibrio sp. Makdt]|uniref:hypothetical protein n=1 Tax=Vibrio sp. Makdt TaxID=2998828 RepID=UPI0022CD398B|nr:hypothetical protein [Vibrio sp. Makdt]MDA0152327.1 hypothetical protein [Vibrio sp. Makdt]
MKEKLIMLVDCIANQGNLAKLIEDQKLCVYGRHVEEVYKLFGSGMFLRSEVPDLLKTDFSTINRLNERFKNANVMKGSIFSHDSIH